ncbi:MAG: hypothetical protein ACI8ZB_003789 [Desulforhopalus sp.]|jgi:hypothetical protein
MLTGFSILSVFFRQNPVSATLCFKTKIQEAIFEGKLKKDIYISILEYGKEKGLEGSTYEEFYQHLMAHGYLSAEEVERFNNPQTLGEEEKKKRLNILRLYKDCFSNYMGGNRTISLDSYFKLIEHQELVEAQQNAKSARSFSIGAIIVALISILISVVFSILQFHQPILLDANQFNEIKTKAAEIIGETRGAARDATRSAENSSALAKELVPKIEKLDSQAKTVQATLDSVEKRQVSESNSRVQATAGLDDLRQQISTIQEILKDISEKTVNSGDTTLNSN